MRGIRRHLTYANVVATLALIIAMAGSAYAINRIGTRDVKNNSLRSADLRNGKAVNGRDVKRNALGGGEIRESGLNAGQLIRLAGDDDVFCDPVDQTPIHCAETSVALPTRTTLSVIGAGAVSSGGAPASATCVIEVDGQNQGVLMNPGESSSVNTSTTATNGFAGSFTSEALRAGPHDVALACAQLGSNDAVIEDPSIAVIAVGAPRN